MNPLRQDLRYGVRRLLADPAAYAPIVLMLSLGIGATSALFSVVNTVLLRPLPYPEPDRLVLLWQARPEFARAELSGPDFLDVRQQSRSFQDMSGCLVITAGLTGNGEPEQVEGALVSASFFSVLGVSPELGRTFESNEDDADRPPAVVLSHRLWVRRFGGRPDVLHTAIVLNGTSYSVAGIMPRGFGLGQSLNQPSGMRPEQLDFWVPLNAQLVHSFGENLRDRGNQMLDVYARLKPGVALSQAQAELAAIGGRLQLAYPVTNRDTNFVIVPLADYLLGDVKSALAALLAAASMVLLLANANAGILLLSKGAARQQEIAIRAALGAGRGQIVRQLLVEAGALAIVAGALSVGVAWCALVAIRRLGPEEVFRLREATLDWPVLVFTLAISAASVLAMGLAPTWYASRPDINEILKVAGRSTAAPKGHAAMRRGLLVAELSIGLVLLISAGVALKSFMRLLAIDSGIDVRKVLTLRIKPNARSYPGTEQRMAFFRRMLQVIAAEPGVERVGAATELPLTFFSTSWPVDIEGAPAASAQNRPVADYHVVGGDFFSALHIPLVKGRLFTEQDDDKHPRTTVVSREFARRYFAGRDAIGKRVSFTEPPVAPAWREIIGIVGDVRFESLDGALLPGAYSSYLQPVDAERPNLALSFAVRTLRDPGSMSPAVRRAVLSVDKDQPVYEVKTMEQYASDSLAKYRLFAFVLVSFAALGVIVAITGLYALVAHFVQQRIQEIGLRMALGAQASDVYKLVLREGVMLAGIGVAIGLPAALAARTIIASWLSGVGASDPVVLVAASLLFLLATLVATFLPARRAVRVDPMIALRED